MFWVLTRTNPDGLTVTLVLLEPSNLNTFLYVSLCALSEGTIKLSGNKWGDHEVSETTREFSSLNEPIDGRLDVAIIMFIMIS